MKIHELKTDPEHFDATARDLKPVEIRFNDRDYQVGDYILSRQTRDTGKEMKEGVPLMYTTHYTLSRITHIQDKIGMQEGWAALSLKVLETGHW